jgi:branched-chain amino acid transport system ATP-binding protein
MTGPTAADGEFPPEAPPAAETPPAPGTLPAAEAPPALLTVDSLATGYGDLRVIWDVSLSASPGRLTAVLGRNGAGKTTLLRAIVGLNRAQAGKIGFDGVDITGEPVHRRIRRGIGFVQENKRIFRRRTVEENLLLGGYVLKVRGKKLRAELPRVYEVFPVLSQRAKATAGDLSGGQQQMLAIGQALMAKPRLLLLDEPSAGLAPAIVGEVMATVGGLKETGLAIVLVEQAVEAAMSVADHVTVLDVGRVVVDSEAGAIDDMAVLRDAYFGRGQPKG